MFSTQRLVERIRDEYAAMPGLKLTREQVCRLWGVGHETCAAALDALLAEGFLHKTGTGKYVALPRPTPVGVTPNGLDDYKATSSLRCPHCGKRNELDGADGSASRDNDTIRCQGCQRIISSSRRSA
jgi:hypothetical protein